jgi:hypothetical protein
MQKDLHWCNDDRAKSRLVCCDENEQESASTTSFTSAAVSAES